MPDGGIEAQMAVLLQRGEEAGQNRLEALTADPVRGFPEHDQGLAHPLTVDPGSDHGTFPCSSRGPSQ
jgi:hypothetical protein